MDLRSVILKIQFSGVEFDLMAIRPVDIIRLQVNWRSQAKKETAEKYLVKQQLKVSVEHKKSHIC